MSNVGVMGIVKIHTQIEVCRIERLDADRKHVCIRRSRQHLLQHNHFEKNALTSRIYLR